ncbi:DnaD domain-containing protein [Rubrobacter naiadicus]|uniref:DnaD domain-containing protein n=1 Tax=Rubrobacter naiadicus TaxID=1392641 RepID=UPI0023613B71|nr:DnaD domain protein [Rubrobacter naiadicus]
MEKIRLTPPGERRARGERARLYVRWMPHLGAEAVALYELLRILPEVGLDEPELEELAELLGTTPERTKGALGRLVRAGFVTERDGWLEVAEHPPSSRPGPDAGGSIEVVRAEPEGITPDDYFRYMGTLPAPHILEFLNGYCERDGLEPDAVREALRIASERDARRVGYVRSILERWVERGVKTLEDVRRFEQDRRLRLVGEGVSGGTDRQSAARRREGYEWLFGEEG